MGYPDLCPAFLVRGRQKRTLEQRAGGFIVASNFVATEPRAHAHSLR